MDVRLKCHVITNEYKLGNAMHGLMVSAYSKQYNTNAVGA